MTTEPKRGEFWVAEVRSLAAPDEPVEREVVQVYEDQVYTCGSEEGYYRNINHVVFVRRVRLK